MIVQIIISLILGIVLAFFKIIPENEIFGFLTQIALCVLLFTIGIDIGSSKKVFKDIKKKGIRLLLVPLSIALGSIVFSALISLFTELTLFETFAIGAGMGYYSLSSIIITNVIGTTQGTIAFLTNIMREVITVVFTPLFVKLFGKLSPVASGGATSMDTTLGVIKQYTNEEIAFIAIVSGIVLTILIPILVTLFSNLA